MGTKNREQAFLYKNKKYLITHKYVEVDDILTHYVETGKGKTILVLPGYPGPWSVYIEMICELSKDFHIIALNLPGFPGSPEELKTGSGLNDFVKFIGDFREKLNLNIYCLLGISFGGAVSLHFAEENQDKIEKLVLQAPAYNVTYITSKLKVFIDLLKFSIKHKYFGKIIFPLSKFLFLTLGVEFIIKENGLENVSKKVKKLVLHDIRELNVCSLAKIGTKMAVSQHTTIFKNIRKPVLVITGGNDPMIPAKVSRHLAERILPKAEFIEIEGANHWLPVLVPELFSQKTIEFMKKSSNLVQ